MSAAHTPGPWVIYRGEICYKSEDDDQSFNMLCPIDLSNDANSNLITSAPDLLAQLSSLLAMCERQDDFNDDGDGRMFERARAAIAKATGGAA